LDSLQNSEAQEILISKVALPNNHPKGGKGTISHSNRGHTFEFVK